MRPPRRAAAAVSDQRGAVLVIFAVFAPVAILFATFAIDAGNWYLHSSHLQVQADAGALAAAQAFQSCSNSAVDAAVQQYSGVAGTPAYNAQVGGTSSANIHEQINSKKYYGSPSNPAPEDASAEEKPPCEANMVDVKLTESNLPWYWNPLSSVNYINAHARVEILQQATAKGLEPLAVTESAPIAARAYFVNEDAKNAILAETPLTKTEVNARGEDVWSNVSAPVSVTINHPHIGVVVALSGKASDTVCAHEFVECFGRKAETEKATVESAEPILHIAGYSTAGTGTALAPLARKVTLTPSTCTDGYFSNSPGNCTFAISAQVDWGSTNAKGVTLSAEVAGKKTTLSNAEGTNGWSGSATLPAGTGSNEVKLLYECKAGGTAPCATTSKTTFADVQRIYAASSAHAGTIAAAGLGAEGGAPQGADSFPECAGCTQKLAVTVDVEGSLSDAVGYSDPLRKLKFGGNDQIIECKPGENPSAARYREHLAQGCPYQYKINTADPSCTTTTEPYDCVEVGVPGVKNGASSGIDDRLMRSPPEGTNFYCPNRWENNNAGGVPILPADDSRIVQTFILPYGALNEKGESSLAGNAAPIQDFATFYVTGFVGDEKKCIEKGDPETSGGFEIWGHFIKYVNLIATEGGGKPKCREDPLGECVAVLTR